jgi:ABC-type multidrug transport system fused ATPase/permease subunit
MEQQFEFRTLIGYATPYRGTLLLIIVLMLCESGTALLSPWLAGRFTETMLNPNSPDILPLQHLVPLWFSVLLIQQILSFSNQFLTGKTGETMAAGMRARLYDHLQSLPLGFFHERRRGEVLTLVTNDAAVISTFVSGTLTGLLPLVISFAGALVLMYLKSPLLALMSGILVPFFFLVMKILGRKIRPLSQQIMEQYGRTFSIVEENLSMLPVIKSFTREKIESERFHKGNQRLLNLEIRYLKLQAILSPAVRFLAAAAILLLLWIGATEVETGRLSTGDLVSLLLYGMMLTSPLSGLAGVYGQIQHTRGAAQRLIDVFSTSPEPVGTNKELPSLKGAIAFSNVHFNYPGRKQILCGIDIDIRAGETVAIIGENGAGKSTLVHLLLRFDDPQQGIITADGTDIKEVSVTSLRRQIGLVQQNVLLLNASVQENILFGQPDADLEEVRQAAQNAHALDFINQLPDGFDTVIGDQGIKLSGGQKQRLALARVLLKKPPILILDEATAMFDPEGEKNFIRNCHDLLHQCTVILITHRPASLQLADRLLRMKNGRLQALSKKIT